MTRDETKKILMMMQCSFPNWKPIMDMAFVIDVWNDDLADYSYEQCYMALKAYKSTNTSGFAPSVGQLIDMIHSIGARGEKELNSNEAWALVMKALCNSNYHAEEEYEKLPNLVKIAVGSPDNLRTLASSSDFNEEVEKSLFARVYDTTVKREKENARLPEAIKRAIIESESHKSIADKQEEFK